jgi:transcriptional regulator with XRE-family HTH domain
VVDAAKRDRHVSCVAESEIERELASALGRKLAVLRKARGLTQEALADNAGVSRNHYQLLEIGLSNRETRRPANPTLATLIALCGVLGVTVPEFIESVLGDSTQ